MITTGLIFGALGALLALAFIYFQVASRESSRHLSLARFSHEKLGLELIRPLAAFAEHIDLEDSSEELESTISLLAALARTARGDQKLFRVSNKPRLQASVAAVLEFLYSHGRFASAVLIGRLFHEARILGGGALVYFALSLTRMEKYGEAISALESLGAGPHSTEVQEQNSETLLMARHCLLELYLKMHSYPEAESLANLVRRERPLDIPTMATLMTLYSSTARTEELDSLASRVATDDRLLIQLLKRSPLLGTEVLQRLIYFAGRVRAKAATDYQ